MRKKICHAVTAFCLIAASSSAFAFSTFPDGSGGVLKWGSSNTPGTPGGTVTWGFIPAGTLGSPYCQTACNDLAGPTTSVSSINIENSPGTGYTLTPLSSLQSYFTDAFNKWASVANISFVGPNPDTGLPIDDAGAGSPNIRIGVFPFSAGGGAVGYAPPPNGGTGAGDILFDANSYYAFQTGSDGDPFPSASTAPNDIESLILHEMGHALGLDHPKPIVPGCPVMQLEGCLFKINRELKSDDVAGIQYIYGAAPVPLPPAVWLFGSALVALGGLSRKKRQFPQSKQ